MRRLLIPIIIYVACAGIVRAQIGRGGQEWTTSNADAQRTSWIRTDPLISSQTMQKPGFQFLWKVKLDNEVRQLNALMQPVLVGNIIGYRGFKSLAVVGGSGDNVWAIDDDLGRIYWKTRLTPSAQPLQNVSAICPGGMTAIPTRPTSLIPPSAGGGRGGNFPGRGTPARGAIGEPGQGFPDIFGIARGGVAQRGAAAPQRGADAPPAAPAPAGAPGGLAASAGPPPGGGGAGQRGNAIYAVGSNGMVHSLSVQTGADVGIAPSSFLPANAKATGLFYSDGVVYASTSNDCAGVSNGVWAIDLGSPEKAVTSFKTNSGSVTGTAGPTFGADGTVYVAVGSGSGSNGSYSNSVVALEPKTLKLRDYFTQPGADFNASPVVFDHKGKDLVIASAKDGRIFVLNSTLLGGTDHHTPLFVTPPGNMSTEDAGALASWEDTGGTRWVLAPATNAIVAFRLTDAGTPALQQGWVSRNMVSPLPPIVVNGVVFTLSSGEYRGGGQITVAQRAQRSTPAILYALDAATGRELWNSGNTITSFAHGGGLAAGAGQVYLTTFDNTFYAFGFPTEH